MKKKLQRMCLGCNSRKEKGELIRIVKSKDKIVRLDLGGKIEGRGAYLCDNILCLEKVKKSKRIEKSLNIAINDDIYEELRGVMIDKTK